MFNFNVTILDVTIGLTLIFLLFSLITTSVMEFISQIFQLRSKNLEVGLKNIFYNNMELLGKFFDHPLIYALYKGDKGKPSYIPSQTFAAAIIDLLQENKNLKTAAALRADLMQNEIPFARAILALMDNGEAGLANTKQNIAIWYDNAMDRVSGWYKKQTQYIILVLSLLVAGSMNVDTLKIANTLSSNGEARAFMTSLAEKTVNEKGDLKLLEKNLQEKISSSTFIPLGWNEYESELKSWQGSIPSFWLMKVLGILVTAFSISFGAPFWFQILSKLVNIRGSGGRPAPASNKENQQSRENPVTLTGAAQLSSASNNQNPFITEDYKND